MLSYDPKVNGERTDVSQGALTFNSPSFKHTAVESGGKAPAAQLYSTSFFRRRHLSRQFRFQAFGLAGTLVALPVSTTILLRQIAAIAAEEGEDLARPEISAECLKIFALGGRGRADDAAESGYFALRIALAEALKGSIGTTILPGFIAAIASRFVGPVGLKLSAQAAPLIGAAAGAAINLAFLEHFRSVARGHFTLRRLERLHGADAVRAAYDKLAATRDVAFAKV
jgi:hypothetical protein